jgi:hypothetical protein
MKNKLFLTLLAAIGLVSISHAQTRFIDVANLGDGVEVLTSSGTTKVNATVLTQNQRWTRDRVYILANNVIVPNGKTLIIEPGTLVRCEFPTVGQGVGAEAALTPADPGALVVAAGGRLIAAGTADAPIIFTSMDDPNVPGGEATIPPYENRTATTATTNITTNSSVTSRVFSITNTSTSFNLNVVFYGSAGVSGTTYGTAKLTNSVAKSNGVITFTNYGYGNATNPLYYVVRSDGTNWFNLSNTVDVATTVAAARTFKNGVNITTNAAGDYTVTGGTMNYNTTTGARHYGKSWTDSNSVASAFKHDGLWGGIVLAGKGTVVRGYGSGINANTTGVTVPTLNPSTGEASGSQLGVQLIEGMAGFANYSWGGGDTVNPPDDSGILRFISNRYGGYVIAVDTELNSFSMYGVGRSTVLEFLEAWNNADDDFEFWGGDVNLSYSISAFCGDDGLDTDQGYLGVVQHFLQLQHNGVGTNGTDLSGRSSSNFGDSLTENDGPESNNSAVPYSTYTLANATLIGRGYGASSYSSGPFAGPNFRDNGGARWYNSIVMDNPHGAVLITDRNLDTVTTYSNAGNSSINRYATNRASGGFDNAGRASDLTTADSSAPTAPDGLFNNVWFYRNGYADSSAVGVEGAYTTREAFATAYASGLPASTALNRFPAKHDRNGRGASANGDVNRANIAEVQFAITNTSNYNVFDTNPGIAVDPYHRLSGMDLRVTNSSAKNLANSSLPSYRGLNSDANFVGAVRDNMWMRGWTIGDALGIYSGNQIIPEVAVSLNGSNQPVITFSGEAGVKYVVQRSTDNKVYTKVTTREAVEGNNTVTDSGAVVGSGAIFYRVIAL